MEMQLILHERFCFFKYFDFLFITSKNFVKTVSLGPSIQPQSIAIFCIGPTVVPTVTRSHPTEKVVEFTMEFCSPIGD